MVDLDVRIVRLPPMLVACFRALSESPENEAWNKLRMWADPRGLLDDPERHPVYGFNNPAPAPEIREYGYEFWIAIDPEVSLEEGNVIKNFPGGLYAVTTCARLNRIGETWKALWDWVHSPESGLTWRRAHELEKPHDPRVSESELVIDLYLPIMD